MTEPNRSVELKPDGSNQLELFQAWFNDPDEITEAEKSTISEQLAVFLREEKERELGGPMRLWSPPNEAQVQ